MQANIWQQTLAPEPIELNPVTLGWTKDVTRDLMPLLTQLPPAPEMVIVMVKCGCQKGLCNAQSSNSMNCVNVYRRDTKIRG